jgi:hypothetical protein
MAPVNEVDSGAPEYVKLLLLFYIQPTGSAFCISFPATVWRPEAVITLPCPMDRTAGRSEFRVITV